MPAISILVQLVHNGSGDPNKKWDLYWGNIFGIARDKEAVIKSKDIIKRSTEYKFI